MICLKKLAIFEGSKVVSLPRRTDSSPFNQFTNFVAINCFNDKYVKYMFSHGLHFEQTIKNMKCKL